MSYLSNEQINEMAEAAVSSFEGSSSWASAFNAAADHAVDEFGIKPRKSAVLLAVKQAKVMWMAYSMAARQEMEGGA